MSAEKVQVIVADDDPDVAEIVGAMLSSNGYSTVLAHSAYEAIGHIFDSKPRVLVTDIKMNGMNGVDLLQRANALPNADLDVILMSGWSILSEKDALAMGSFGLLDKPFDETKLVAMVAAAARRLEDRWCADGKLPNSTHRIDDRIVTPEVQELIAFGRSGMFVPLPSGNLPEENAFIDLALTATSIGPVNGIGRVRWVRDAASGEQPRGFGVEYVTLTDMTRQSLVKNLRETRNMSCIPSRPDK